MRGKNPISKYLIISIIILAIGLPGAYAITITLGGNPVIINGILDMTGNKITNVDTPITTTDAATKGYVDSNNFQFIKTVERVGSQFSASGMVDNDAIVNCMVGEVATGGGFHEITVEIPVIFDSEPIITNGVPTGWTIGFFSGDGATVTITATVICATLQNTAP